MANSEILEMEAKGLQKFKSKKVLGGILTLFILIMGGFFWYQKHISTPEYIVSGMIMAYSKHDIDEFEKYVDIEAFSKTAWSDYKEWRDGAKPHPIKVMSKDITSNDSFASIVKNLIKGKKNFDDLDTYEESSKETVSLASVLKEVHDYKISNTQEMGEAKTFRLNAKTFSNHDISFDFKMVKQNGGWKIVEVTNIAEICEDYITFSKDSVITYLKESQKFQDIYINRNNEMDKMQGKYMLSFFNEKNIPTPSPIYVKNTLNKIKEFLDARIQNEQGRAENLSQIQTNKFSEIINSNRINCSKHMAKAMTLMNDWVDAGMAANNFFRQDVREIRNKANEEMKISNEYNERVTWMVDSIGYKKAIDN